MEMIKIYLEGNGEVVAAERNFINSNKESCTQDEIKMRIDSLIDCVKMECYKRVGLDTQPLLGELTRFGKTIKDGVMMPQELITK